MKPAVVSSLVAFLAASAAVVAQSPAPSAEPQSPPQYEVEIIVFANLDFDPGEEHFEQADDLAGGAANGLREAPVFDDSNLGTSAPRVDPLAALQPDPLRIRLLRPDELKLGSEYRRLQALAGYRPLVHAGWVQPGLPEADAEPFDLGMLGILNPHGTVRVHLGRFLHIALDLTYQSGEPIAAGQAANDGLGELALRPRYRLAATRSARSNELHYFDHPAFGVLVRVTPLPAENTPSRRPAA
jgi:hypothetical protein